MAPVNETSTLGRSSPPGTAAWSVSCAISPFGVKVPGSKPSTYSAPSNRHDTRCPDSAYHADSPTPTRRGTVSSTDARAYTPRAASLPCTPIATPAADIGPSESRAATSGSVAGVTSYAENSSASVPRTKCNPYTPSPPPIRASISWDRTAPLPRSITYTPPGPQVLKTMTPDSLHAPEMAEPVKVMMVRTGPPPRGTTRNSSPAANASSAPSGEKKGSTPPSVPPITCASSCDRPRR